MMFAILGLLMAALEVYAWLFRANSHPSPNAITLGLPIVIAAGILKRPREERLSILVFAAMLALSLNRALISPQMLVHILELGGAVCLIWWTYRRPDLNRVAFSRLVLLGVITLGAFVLVWFWQLT